MREKVPNRSINTKDIFLILLGWVIKKVLDFMWAKTKVKVHELKLKPETLGNWLLHLSCRLLGYRAVTSPEERRELIIDLRHNRVNEKIILFWEKGEFHRFIELPDIVEVLKLFAMEKAHLILGQQWSVGLLIPLTGKDRSFSLKNIARKL